MGLDPPSLRALLLSTTLSASHLQVEASSALPPPHPWGAQLQPPDVWLGFLMYFRCVSPGLLPSLCHRTALSREPAPSAGSLRAPWQSRGGWCEQSCWEPRWWGDVAAPHPATPRSHDPSCLTPWGSLASYQMCR